jgi:hypothetical protein
VRYEDNSFSEHKRRGMFERSYSPERYHQRFPMNSRRGRTSRRGPGQSPRRSRKERRVRRAGHQSTTSESDSETEKDETKFEKRKKKSMNQARARCLPMNLTIEDIQKGRLLENLPNLPNFYHLCESLTARCLPWKNRNPGNDIACALRIQSAWLIVNFR